MPTSGFFIVTMQRRGPLCNQQLQLMEHVFILLRFDAPRNRTHHINRGWIHQFRRWARVPTFRRFWAVSIGGFGIDFQNFCEEALDLRTDKVIWRKDSGAKGLRPASPDQPPDRIEPWEALIEIPVLGEAPSSSVIAFAQLEFHSGRVEMTGLTIDEPYRRFELMEGLVRSGSRR